MENAQQELVELPAGISRAEYDAWVNRQARAEVASVRPLPGPLAPAFAGEPVKVGKHVLVPITAGHIAILQRIKSPLLRAVELLATGKTKEEIAALDAQESLNGDGSEMEATIETLYVFTQPPRVLREVLAKGRANFRETAMSAVGDGIGVVEMADIGRVIGEHFASAFSTVQQHEPQKDDGGFQKPPAEPLTGSVGG